MKARSSNRSSRSRGVTLFELVVLVTAFGALTRLAVPNFYEFRKRAADASARAVFEEIRDTLSVHASDESTPPTLIFNQRGHSTLPAPFSDITISEHMRVNYIIRLQYPGFFDVTALEVSHDLGAHYYRMIWVNNKRIEQVVAK